MANIFYLRRYATLYISALAIFSLPSANSNILNFETTRLKSTAGAGVASVLMNEAVVLNPAPLALFQNGSFYFQRSSGQMNQFSPGPANGPGNAPLEASPSHKSKQFSTVVADAKSKLKGAFGYTRQTYSHHRRQQLMAAFAHPAGKKSSVGINYQRIKEHRGDHQDRYGQANIGVMHALNEQFTMGMVFVDPMRRRKGETRGLLGGQYVYQDMVSFILDIGADYNHPLDKTFLWRGAIQFKLLDDFYLRLGAFDDKGKREEGTGVGLGWIGPRLVFDFALKNTGVQLATDGTLSQNTTEIRETSFGLAYRF